MYDFRVYQTCMRQIQLIFLLGGLDCFVPFMFPCVPQHVPNSSSLLPISFATVILFIFDRSGTTVSLATVTHFLSQYAVTNYTTILPERFQHKLNDFSSCQNF
jgi:hypothetical protein